MTLFISLILFVYGTVFGSFLNVVIYRTPKKEQIVKGRSKCTDCGHTLAWYDLFPIFSWLFLRGRCRYCKTPISSRYAFVESLCGLSYVWAFLTLNISINLAFALVLFPILICLSYFDIDSGEIEYWCPVSIGLLGMTAFIMSALSITQTPWYQHILGAVIISVPFAILLLFGAMGGADVQLMAAAGFLLGWKIIPAALIGIFLGAIFGIVFKATRKPQAQTIYNEYDDDADRDESPAKGTVIRFGPFLAFGIAVGFLHGDSIIGWYLSFMGM